MGSSTSTLSLHDIRLLEKDSNSKIWSISDAHSESITDIAFNTFIPYWLASAGDDGVVKMWDIRFLKGAAARIDAHYGSISSVC
jgi:WD40 repeat protein